MKRVWLYAITSAMAVIVLTYCSDIRWLISETEQLNAEVIELKEQTMRWHAQQAAQVVTDSHQRAKTNWPSFLKAINFNHASVKTIAAKKDGISAYQAFHVKMETAKYEELTYLLEYLARDNDKYAILSFYFNLSKNNLLQAELTIRDEVSKSYQHTNVIAGAYTFPFCGKYHLPKTRKDAPLFYSLKVMQLGGVMRVGQQKQALIKFPDGTSRWMYELQRLGKEGGQIQSINLHQILISMPNDKQIILGGI